MKILPIADCRLPIKASFAGRGFARRGHDGSKFIGFFEQRGQFFYGHDACLREQFEPQSCFVRFFLNSADFGNKFCGAARAATGAVVCRHGSSAPQNLFGNDAARVVVFWNRPAHLDDPQGKSFRSCLKFGRIHGIKLQTQSAIGNRQSAISK